MTSASLLIVLFVGTVVGTLTGLAVGASFSTLYLAILAGFLGAIAATIVRNFFLAGDSEDDFAYTGLGSCLCFDCFGRRKRGGK